MIGSWGLLNVVSSGMGWFTGGLLWEVWAAFCFLDIYGLRIGFTSLWKFLVYCLLFAGFLVCTCGLFCLNLVWCDWMVICREL